MENQDILKHLMDIEQKAQLLQVEARAESDRRVGAAKKEAQARFDKEYGEKAKALEVELSRKKAGIQKGYESGIADYVRSLESVPIDEKGLRSMVGKILSGNS